MFETIVQARYKICCDVIGCNVSIEALNLPGDWGTWGNYYYSNPNQFHLCPEHHKEMKARFEVDSG